MSKGGLSAIDLLSIEQTKARLHTLDADFKRYHVDVINALDNDDEIEEEGDVMEEHEDKMAQIIITLKSICSSVPTTSSETKTLRSRQKARNWKLYNDALLIL